MPEEIFPVHSRRAARQRRVQRARHVFAALILMSAGINRLSPPHAGISLLAVSEIAAGVLLIASLVRERLQKGHHGGIAWVELAGAVMVFIEVTEMTRGRHHVSFVILSYAQPVVLLLFALFDARISAARYLKAGDDAFVIRLLPFFWRQIPWETMSAFRVDGNAIEFDLISGGRRRVSLREIAEREAALAWSAEQLRRRGIREASRG